LVSSDIGLQVRFLAPPVCFLLSAVSCLLSASVYCLLLSTGCCLLSAICCLLPAVCMLSPVCLGALSRFDCCFRKLIFKFNRHLLLVIHIDTQTQTLEPRRSGLRRGNHRCFRYQSLCCFSLRSPSLPPIPFTPCPFPGLLCNLFSPGLMTTNTSKCSNHPSLM
jgi:hypothetical protein